MNYVRLPLSFVLYLIYRVIRWHECGQLLMKFGPVAVELYKRSTPSTFKEFVNGR